jgi:thioredoxin reductase
VYAAGDASVDSQMVVVAASEGARAAIAIHEELLDEELGAE